MTTFEDIYLRNFSSYKELKFLFVPGLNLLEGDNGSGKSTILPDGLLWVTYGKTSKGVSADDIIRNGQQDAFGRVQFSRNTKKYKIERTRLRGRTTHLKLFEDGKDVSFPDMRITQASITNLIRIPYNTMRNTLMFSGNMSESFTRSSDADNKIMLTNLVGFEQIETALKEVKSYVKEIEQQMSDTRNRIEVLQSLISEKKVELEKEIVNKKETKDVSKELLELVGNADKLKDQLSKLEKYCGELEKEERSIHSKYSEERGRKNVLQEQKAKYEKLIGRGICPTCEQEIEKSKLQQKVNKENKDLESLTKKLNKLIEDENKKKEEVAKVRDLLRRAKEELNSMNTKISGLKQEQERTAEDETRISGMKEKIKEYDDELKKKEKERDSKIGELEKAKFWADGFSPTGIKNYILESIIPDLNKNIEYYIEHMFSGQWQVRISPTTTIGSGAIREKWSIDVSGRVDDYKKCSSGEKRRIDLVILLALNRLLRMKLGDVNLLCLDETFGSLDQDGIQNSIVLLNELRKEIPSIYIATHLPDLKEKCSFDNVYYIEWNKDGSTVTSS